MADEDLKEASWVAGLSDIEHARFKRDPAFEAGKMFERLGLTFESDADRNAYGEMAVNAVYAIIDFLENLPGYEDGVTPDYVMAQIDMIGLATLFQCLLRHASKSDAVEAIVALVAEALKLAADTKETAIQDLERMLAEVRAM